MLKNAETNLPHWQAFNFSTILSFSRAMKAALKTTFLLPLAFVPLSQKAVSRPPKLPKFDTAVFIFASLRVSRGRGEQKRAAIKKCSVHTHRKEKKNFAK